MIQDYFRVERIGGSSSTLVVVNEQISYFPSCQHVCSDSFASGKVPGKGESLLFSLLDVKGCIFPERDFLTQKK